MEFVTFLGEDKESWGQVQALLNRLEYDKAVVVRDKKAADFPKKEGVSEVRVDSSKPLTELKEEIMKGLKENLSGDFEVLLSIASGNGKEHMAIISALLSIPVGIRMVVYTKEGVKYLT